MGDDVALTCETSNSLRSHPTAVILRRVRDIGDNPLLATRSEEKERRGATAAAAQAVIAVVFLRGTRSSGGASRQDMASDDTSNPNSKCGVDREPVVDQRAKRKRNLPGTPDPKAEVIALSPETLLAASSFVCEVCGKEFRRGQNLQIHRRGHNLPWNFPAEKAPAEAAAARRRVYVCPEASCVYHDPSRALGDLTGIKKHYSRKHGEKKWECEWCSKKYAVHTDWKAHTKICGTREYECHCGTLFSRKDSFLVHRQSCETLEPAEEREASLSGAAAAAAEAGKIDSGSNASAMNRELLSPSLWGKSTEQERSEGS